MNRTGWKHAWSREQDNSLHENDPHSSMESWQLPCCNHVTPGCIIQCLMVHRSRLGSFGSKFLSIWLESKAKKWWFILTMHWFIVQESCEIVSNIPTEAAPSSTSLTRYISFGLSPFCESEGSAQRTRYSRWNQPSWRSGWNSECHLDRRATARFPQLDRTHWKSNCCRTWLCILVNILEVIIWCELQWFVASLITFWTLYRNQKRCLK
jgi:hypothetical protein